MWMTVLYGASFLLIDSWSMKNVDLIVLKCALYSVLWLLSQTDSLGKRTACGG